MSAFTNALPLKHTHNKAQTNNLLHFDLYFGFHLPLPWPLNGNIEKQANVYCQGCNPEGSDLWPVRLFHRGNNDLTQEMSRVLMWPQKVVTVWDWAISATARGRFVPRSPRTSIEPILKMGTASSTILFKWGMVIFIFSPPMKDQRAASASASTCQLLLLTAETEARLRCKHLDRIHG